MIVVGEAGKKTFVYLAKVILNRPPILIILDFSGLSAEAGVTLDVSSAPIEKKGVTLFGTGLFADISRK